MRTFEYRLYPTRQQYEMLMACLRDSRLLYNEMLEHNKEHYRQTGKFWFKYDLCAMYKGRSGEYVPASTVQTLADRLDKALRQYLSRKAEGKAAGFPRFKKPNQWHSIQLRQYGTHLNVWLDSSGKYLHVPAKLGKLIKVKLHRPIEGVPKTAYLVLRADNHWYVQIVCETVEHADAERLHRNLPQCSHPEIGIDLGIESFITDSEGRKVANPRFLKQSMRRLRILSRTVSRRQKGSRRHRKASRRLAKLYLTISRRRRDFAFKTARPYAENYGRIVVENLRVSNMIRHPIFARSILDVSWSQFISILEDKAERAGHEVVRVVPNFTSQDCSRCGARVEKGLHVRTHRCPVCGYVADRDENAALNILRAGAQPSGTVPDGGTG